MEDVMSLFFMVFGLAFFIYVTNIVRNDQREDLRDKRSAQRESYERRVMEAREFGFGGKDNHNAKTLHDKDE